MTTQAVPTSSELPEDEERPTPGVLAGAVRAGARTTAMVLWTLVMLPVGLSSFCLRPLGRARAARWGASGSRVWARGLTRILGVRVEIRGEPPADGSFAASNHVSWLDILVLSGAYRTNFIAKSEIAGWPVFGLLARLGGTLWIDREQMRDTARMRDELHYFLDEGVTITVFPEGWISDGSAVGPFRPPLFATPAALAVPCVPVAVTYRTPGAGPGAAGPDDGNPHRTVCWWDDTPLVKHFLRLAALPRVHAILSFGEPVSGVTDRKRLAAALHARASDLFEPVPR